jgi:hypothetical protein
MNEYYYIRYNLYKYFLNIEDDTYNYNLSLIISILYILLILLTLFALLLLKNITGFTIIYIILLVFFYIITYKLIISLKSISTNETLIKYKNFYELRNIIFKENLQYALNQNKKNIRNQNIDYLYSNKDTIIKNINNTENIYGNDAKKILNTSYDLLKYFDLNEYIEKGFYNRLYVENINFIQTSLPYIIKEKIDEKIDEKIITYINFELLEDYPQQQKELLKYLDLKYNKKLSFTSKNILTADFNKKLNNLISNYKINIYYYIAISVCFIIILLHGLFVYFNKSLAFIYFSLIIISLIILYYFN